MEYIFQLKLFVFIFSILYLIRYLINVIAVMKAEEGKINNTTVDLILLGSSISYIITVLITGF